MSRGKSLNFPRPIAQISQGASVYRAHLLPGLQNLSDTYREYCTGAGAVVAWR